MAPTDYNDYNGGDLVGTAATFLALTYVSVGLRTYVRGFLTKSFQADDWLMLIAQAIFTASCVFILLGVGRGLGHHNKALPQDKEIDALMWQALATATYVLNMMFVKLSLGFFLLRLAVQKRYIYTLYVTMAIVLIWSTVLFFWDIFQCKPVAAQWDYTIPDAKCVTAGQIVSAAYALSVLNIITDWLYALLPIPMIWQVKMTSQAKWSVILVLGLGIFASVATLIRLAFLADLTDTDDILFAGTEAMVWTLIEPGIAIVASSLVTIRPLLRAWRLKGFESTERTGGTGGPSGPGSRALRSGTQRSNRGGPRYGSEDLTLVDLEAAQGGGRDDAKIPAQATTLSKNSLASKTSRLSRISEARNGTPVWGGAVPDAETPSAKSEVFVIEGPAKVHNPPALWRGDSSPSFVSDDMDGLEAQSQHSGKVGLGGRR